MITIHEESDRITERIEDGLKLLSSDGYTNKGKITFVGSEFILAGWLWKIEIYNPDKDEYWIVREDNNPTPISAGWVSASWFRSMWIYEKIKVMGEWYLPR